MLYWKTTFQLSDWQKFKFAQPGGKAMFKKHSYIQKKKKVHGGYFAISKEIKNKILLS